MQFLGHKRIFTIGRLVSYLFLCAGCEKDSGPGTTHLEIRITSPKNSSFYFKLNKIPFECEAYDSAGMPIEVDSVRWTSNIDGTIALQYQANQRFYTPLRSPGKHIITAQGFRGTYLATEKISLFVSDSSTARLAYEDSTWRVYNVPAEYIFALETDNHGNIAIATFGNGLIYFKDNKWLTFKISNSGIPTNNIECIAFNSQNILFVGGGTDAFVASYDGLHWSSLPTDDSLSDVHTMTFHNDTLWAGFHGGNIMYFDVYWHTIPSQPRRFGHPGRILFDANGVLWGNSEHAGSYSFDGSSWTLFNSSTVGPPGCSSSLAIDNMNRVWFGTCSDGLFLLDNGVWTIYNTSNSQLPSNNVTAIRADHNNAMWIGTSNGLAVLKDDKWVVFNPENSPLLESWISGVTVDDSNHVWISTGNTVSIFKQ